MASIESVTYVKGLLLLFWDLMCHVRFKFIYQNLALVSSSAIVKLSIGQTEPIKQCLPRLDAANIASHVLRRLF